MGRRSHEGRRRRAPLTFLVAAGVAGLVTRHALADPAAPSVDVRTWAPSADPRANLVLEPASSADLGTVALGAWARYESDAVAIRGTGGGSAVTRPVANELGLDLVASLGLGPHAQVGLAVPVSLYEQGSSGQPTWVVSSGRVPTTSLGDISLHGKASLLANDKGGFGLALLGAFTLPTGAATSFLSDAGPTVTVRALADVSILVASLQASLGYTLRTRDVTWPDTAPAGVRFGDQIPWTLGVLVRPAVLHAIDPSGRHAWEVALHGSLPAGPVGPFGIGNGGSAALSPVLLALSDRVGIGHYQDGYVLAGVDVGLDQAIGVPSVRATVSFGWRFASHDRDGDGIPDDVDQCPTLAEDLDGFEDSDGCPEADNDNDGIVDADDACPNVPGVASADPRKNGCPSPPAVPATPPPPSSAHEP